jgi:hypothetical protein
MCAAIGAHGAVIPGTESAWSISRAVCCAMPLVCCRHSVTGPDSLRWVSVEPLGPGLAQLPGFQPGGEVPDDHCRPIHRARHDPARLHRPRTARPRRVPGRVPRPDPRGLHPRPAPVHWLVSQPFPVAVLGAPRRHRKLRPATRSQRPSPRHGHPAAVHHRRVLQVRRRRRTPGSLARRLCPAAAGRLRVTCRRAGPQRARRAAGGRRARPACGARARLLAGLERPAGLRSGRRRHRAPRPGTRAPRCAAPGSSRPQAHPASSG